MHVASIETVNWLPFRGRTRLDLGPKAYGLVAKRIGDSDSSNWLGKTSLLSTVGFALFGSHPAKSEDEWITRGEDEGSVAIVLSDGLRIERSRRRGLSTQLVATPPGAPPCAKDEAQALVGRWIGLSEKDFALAHLAQKRMQRFVSARPAERFADVATWLRLGPLRAAEQDIRSRLSALVDRETRLVAAADLLRRRLEGVGTIEELRRNERAAMLATQKAAEDVRRLEVAVVDRAERRWLAERAREHEAARRELDEATAATKAPPAVQARSAVDDKAHAHREAKGAVSRLRVLARGEFDGACPVAGIACPAKDAINAKATEHAKALRDAERAETAARIVHESARADEERAQRAAIERAAVDARVGWLKRRVAETQGAANALAHLGPEPEGDPSGELRRAQIAANEAGMTSARLASELRQAERDAAELSKAESDLAAVRREAGTLREAAAILGRAGAQRRLARAAVSSIERGANERLSASGIGLSVALTWGRETGDLAASCDACGDAFPAGRAVKTCRCGAERGPKLVDELGCELSSVSGAAEDLAGIALSLSAAAWLRADRTSGWGVALIDEPFGSLDVRNRESLARALAAMLSPSGGWEQALVVAHHEAAMEALPGRIQIIAGPYGSWARVV